MIRPRNKSSGYLDQVLHLHCHFIAFVRGAAGLSLAHAPNDEDRSVISFPQLSRLALYVQFHRPGRNLLTVPAEVKAFVWISQFFIKIGVGEPEV